MPSSTTEPKKRLRFSAQYTSKIIKAGALIGDTKTLLSHWNVDASVDENIKRAQRNNVFGKASRSRVEDILAIFRQRYLTENSVTQALVTLVRGKFPTAFPHQNSVPQALGPPGRRKFPAAALEQFLYFPPARADQVLPDAVIEI